MVQAGSCFSLSQGVSHSSASSASPGGTELGSSLVLPCAHLWCWVGQISQAVHLHGSLGFKCTHRSLFPRRNKASTAWEEQRQPRVCAHCHNLHSPLQSTSRTKRVPGSSSHVTLDVGKEGKHVSLFPAPLPVRQVTFSELCSSRERQPGKCSCGA